MSIIGFVVSDMVFIVLTILSIRKCSHEDKDSEMDWLLPLLTFISILASGVVTVFSPHFTGQIESGMLTGTSVLAGIIIIVLTGIYSNLEETEVEIQDDDEILGIDFNLEEIEARIQKHDEVLGWIISMLGVLYLFQAVALILHIIYIYIPQIVFLANLNL